MNSNSCQTNLNPTPSTRPSSSHGLSKGTVIEFAFLIFALAPIIHFRNNPAITAFALTFSAIILEAIPFLLLGSLAGGLIEFFTPREKLGAWFGKGNRRAVFLAAGIGLIFPICECAIIPVIKKLLDKGIPFSAAVAFLLGGPIVNPIVFGSTIVAYSMILDVAVIRLVLGYMIAVFIGFAAGRLLDKKQALLEESHPDTETTHCASSTCFLSRHEDHLPGLMDALTHGAMDFLDMFRYLIFGAFAAALIQNLVNRDIFILLSGNPIISILLMMALASLMSLCSEADAFVASSFQFSLPLSSQLAFMVLGPMFDIKLLFMSLGLFKKRAVGVIYGLTIFTVFIVMALFNILMGWAFS